MNGIIIDDDSTIRILLREYCKLHENINILEEFGNGIEAFNYLKTNKVDLVFLDIHMPILTGVDLVKSLTNIPNIIMVTSDPDFALDAFQYTNIIDYLLKPLTYSRFSLAIQKITSIQNTVLKDNKSKESLFVISQGRNIKLMFDDIEFIEANSDYVNIKVESKKHIVNSTLKNIKQKLPEINFIQVHRSFIVNINKVSELEDNTLIIGKSLVPVSKSYRNDVLSKLNFL
jgi:two-component system response regulator LytT